MKILVERKTSHNRVARPAGVNRQGEALTPLYPSASLRVNDNANFKLTASNYQEQLQTE